MEKLIKQQNIDPLKISLIKVDIEGGELILVPALQKFLKKYKPVFFISLHYCFLKFEHIKLVVDILFNIYNKCYLFTDEGVKKQIKKETIINEKKNDKLLGNAIVFE